MTTKIMVADDSLFARMLAKEAISKVISDAEFTEATSGQQTLELAERTAYQFSWYLLDMNMGGPDGVKTAQELIARGVNPTQIALVTGNRSKDLQSEAGGLGVTYINKTINPADVDQFIERLRNFFSHTGVTS